MFGVSSFSLHFLDNRTQKQDGTFFIPLAQIALWSLAGVKVHTWSPNFLHGKFPDFFECPRGTLLGAHSMVTHVNVDSVFSDHNLMDGGTALLAILFCESYSSRPRMEGLASVS